MVLSVDFDDPNDFCNAQLFKVFLNNSFGTILLEADQHHNNDFIIQKPITCQKFKVCF